MPFSSSTLPWSSVTSTPSRSARRRPYSICLSDRSMPITWAPCFARTMQSWPPPQPAAPRRLRPHVGQLVAGKPARVLVLAGRANAQLALVASNAEDVGDVALPGGLVLQIERLGQGHL